MRGRTLEAEQSAGIVPLVDEGLGNSSYVVALGDGRALVLDPRRDPTPYLNLADELKLRIAFAVETHLHADFISGSRELAAFGAAILAPRASHLATAYRGLEDGEEVELGGLTLRAVATPGHTPEHFAYVLLDGSTPRALFSGGAILPGGAARPDLIGPEQTEPLAHDLYRSAHQRLRNLPDELAVYPTHGAGSFCSAGTDGPRTTSLGRERETSPLFKIATEDGFVRTFLDGLGTYPPYFLRLRAVNQRGARLYGVKPPELTQLSVDEFRRQQAAGAIVIDVRPFVDFGRSHIPAALSIALRPAFASWLGWIIQADRPLVFVRAPNQDGRDLIEQCLKIGYENLVGELAGGMSAWQSAGLPVSTIATGQVNEEPRGTPLDVRQASEWPTGHIPGARHVELGSITAAAGAIPAGPLLIYCGHGERAMTAASLLEGQGHKSLAVLDGGFDAWRSANRPIAIG
ncbi:MAG: rhodanese-like domain-containing protein [Candidatus Dormibacteraeota bacterium]|nr:rhodanese-like domain-containing protein [Candidatus Dormibacteraeota bacterium]